MYFPGNPDLQCRRDRATDVWKVVAEISGFAAACLLVIGIWVLA